MARYASRNWRSFNPDSVVAGTPARAARKAVAPPRRVLGLDPGSIRMGFGVIDCKPAGEAHVASGCVRVAGADLAARLRHIHEQVLAIVTRFEPDEIAIERVFMHRNADSALKLGQARGAALSATFATQPRVFEYAAREVKQAIVGTGGAEKEQVALMVKRLLNIEGALQADAADALAIALCHVHSRRMFGQAVVAPETLR